MTARQITVSFDDGELGRYTDSYLAGLWHLAQLNPAPLEDEDAGDIVSKLQAEIVTRWLRQTAPELYHHQPRHPYWMALTKLATYQDGQWVPKQPETADE